MCWAGVRDPPSCQGSCGTDLSSGFVNRECLSTSVFTWVGRFLVLCTSFKRPSSKVELTLFRQSTRASRPMKVCFFSSPRASQVVQW